MKSMDFGKDFVWGAATAAYQIEGAHDLDGRGPSVWDDLCRKTGAVKEGANGNVACDHYHRYLEDVDLMRRLSLQAYRFSFSWSRILPDGVGRINDKGLEFYDRLIDALLENGVTPYPTLFHWDYPSALFHRGGWLSPDSPQWFGEYVALLADRYSDRITHWFTLNEPSCFLGLGHFDGVHAPGIKLSATQFLLAVKHAMMAHGVAVQTLRARSKRPAWISYAPLSHIGIPESETPADIAAAKDCTFGIPGPERSFWFESIYLDSVLKGIWPEESAYAFAKSSFTVTDSELATMHQPLDALGLNYYAAPTIRAGRDGRPETVTAAHGAPRTAFDWAVAPDGLYWLARFHHERYGLPIYITENGLSNLDWVSEDGAVHDPQRIDFTSRYLKALHRARAEGMPADGYFHWSLIDNFEWAEGYRHRFGLIHVDFQTQKRTIKDSGYWYRNVIESNGASLFKPLGSGVVEANVV